MPLTSRVNPFGIEAGDPHSRSGRKRDGKQRMSRHSLETWIADSGTELTFAFGREFAEEAVCEAGADIRTSQEVARSTSVLDDGADVHGSCEDGGVGRTLRFAASQWSMLAYEVEVVFASGVRPEPSL